MRNKEDVKGLLVKLLKIVLIAGVTEEGIRSAPTLPWKDFKSPVQYSVAMQQEMDGIATRDPSDYKEAEMKVEKGLPSGKLHKNCFAILVGFPQRYGVISYLIKKCLRHFMSV